MYGDARTGKFSDNLLAFARSLRRAGVACDVSRVALAQRALSVVGIASRTEVSAALESVMVSQPQDIAVFRELFDAFFKDPEVAQKLMSQLLPQAEAKGPAPKAKPRVREALSPQKAFGKKEKPPEEQIEFDAAMTAGELRSLKAADFNALSASEYRLVMRLATQIRLDVPHSRSRRYARAPRGRALDVPGSLRAGLRTQGELLRLRERRARRVPLPILVMVDVSGSMERYSRLLLAYLHASTQHLDKRDVFAFGTELYDLKLAFASADTDEMLKRSCALITNFAGGTRLADALAAVREQHRAKLIGRRTLVLLITDGLDTAEPAALERELIWLKRHTGRVLWLNPLLRFEAYAPIARAAAVMARHADAMLAVHNIDKLEQLSSALRQVLRMSSTRT